MSIEKKFKRSICWFRRDLRNNDHVALANACQSSDEVIAVFVFDSNILSQLEDEDDRRITFICEALEAMNLPMVIRHGDPKDIIPSLMKELKSEALFFNKDYEPYAISRDLLVEKKLKGEGCEVYSFRDHVIFEECEILNGQGEPYRVFTPYKNNWKKTLTKERLSEVPIDLKKVKSVKVKSLKPSPESIGFKTNKNWTDASQSRSLLMSFDIKKYASTRNSPELDGTSKISVHLRFGTISTRAVFRLAIQKDGLDGVWCSQLIWREFYFMILSQFSYVSKSAFKKQYEKLKWPGSKKHLAAWKLGQTGFPLIDAAMRCLVQTGWMHNRLRMVTASFLTKDLLVDWREGEKYFARYLLDFDLAANNGGWQWCASTGADAQPYFRIFNPTEQSKKYDPVGTFIKEYCPELKGFDKKHIHAPWQAPEEKQKQAQCIVGSDYPEPIVNHRRQSMKAIELFKK